MEVAGFFNESLAIFAISVNFKECLIYYVLWFCFRVYYENVGIFRDHVWASCDETGAFDFFGVNYVHLVAHVGTRGKPTDCNRIWVGSQRCQILCSSKSRDIFIFQHF